MNTSKSKSKYIPGTHIPKIIWTYWHSDNGSVPITVIKCIESWTLYNPDYEIIVLDKKNLKKYVKKDLTKLKRASDFPARLSDFARINVLAKYGGIWMDATNVSTGSFDEWVLNNVGKYDGECIAYYIKRNTYIKKYPIIENWFFACKKGSKFINKVCSEFMSINKYDDVYDYVDYLEKDLGVNLQGINDFDDPGYLTQHCSMQKILQYDEYPISQLKLFKAESGPFKYLSDGNWKPTATKLIIKNPKKYITEPFIKFTGPERNYLEDHPIIRNKIFDIINI